MLTFKDKLYLVAVAVTAFTITSVGLAQRGRNNIPPPTVPTQPERYPGQASHGKPPEGWTCEPQNTRNTVPIDHVCFCHRMEECALDENQRGVTEDSKCQVYCHPEHCGCPIQHCDEGSDWHPPTNRAVPQPENPNQ